MANNFEAIKELTNGKNTMTLTNSIMRAYGIPLDYSSVQESYAIALEYAKTNAKAYIGQLITVDDVLYVVTDEAGGYLKKIGANGDGKSITVDENGVISLYGFTAAENATLPRKKANGTIEWVPIDTIVKGDGNEKTRVVAAEGSDITVSEHYEAGTDTYTYTLDVRLPAIPNYTVTKTAGTGSTTYQLTKDGEAVGEAIVVPDAYDDTALAGRVSGAEAAVADHGGRLTTIEGKVNTFLEAADASEAAIDTLKEIQQYIANDTTGASGMLESIQANAQAIETLNGIGTGSVKQAIDNAIATQAAADAAKYATQETVNAVSEKANAAAVKTEVDTALAGKANAADLANFYCKSDVYTKDEITALLNGVTGGSQVTAASLKQQLDDHASENAKSFAAVTEKNNAQDQAITANTNAIADIVASGTGIYDRAVAAAATDATTKVEALAEGAVKQNTSDIAAINNQISGINNNVTSIGTRVGTLETKAGTLETDLATEVGAREELGRTVATHGTEITGIKTRLTDVEAVAAANTSKFADYSTTAQVETKIREAVTAIDHTALENGISANATAISNEVTRAKAREDAIAELVSANATLAGQNKADIAALESAINAVIENEDGETLNSIKELAAWIDEHDTDLLPVVEANAEAIKTLTGTGEGSVQQIVADAIDKIPATPVATGLVAGVVKASNEVTVAPDGVMGIGQVSTDKLVQGNDTLVLNGGNSGVSAQQ
jgi:hypothetical protein